MQGTVNNPNSYFLKWKQHTAVKIDEDVLQYIKMYVAGVQPKLQMEFQKCRGKSRSTLGAICSLKI